MTSRYDKNNHKRTEKKSARRLRPYFLKQNFNEMGISFPTARPQYPPIHDVLGTYKTSTGRTTLCISGQKDTDVKCGGYTLDTIKAHNRSVLDGVSKKNNKIIGLVAGVGFEPTTFRL